MPPSVAAAILVRMPILLVIACLWLLGMTIFRMAARQDADEAHRNLARLLADTL